MIGTHGFYVDVTPSMKDAHNEHVSEAVAESAEARSGIEQAKGMLMLIYQINAEWHGAAEVALTGDQHQAAGARRANCQGLPRSSLRRGVACQGRVRQVAADLASACRVLRFIRCADREICRTSDCGFLAANLGAGSGCLSQSERHATRRYKRARGCAPSVVVGALSVGFLVTAALWVSTCNGATADTAACGVPQRTMLAIGAPVILLIGGLRAFVRTYQTWGTTRRGGRGRGRAGFCSH